MTCTLVSNYPASWIGACFLGAGVVLATSAFADSVLTLKTTYIEAIKDKVTIDVEYTVDKAHKQPNPPDKDGDLHAAGRSDEIGLATVAEIENAHDLQDAVDRIHAAETSGQPIKLAGVWRIWPEHGGEHEFIQGTALERFDTTNPPHVFEIHPITNIGGESLLQNLHPIQGYHTKDAREAFTTYERTRSTIEVNSANDTVKMTMPMAGYNYVEFIMRLTSRQLQVAVEGGDLLLRRPSKPRGEVRADAQAQKV